MKKILSLIVLALLPIVANAYDAEIDGIYYSFYEDKAKVTYRDNSYNSYSGAVVIPEYVNYNGITYSVTNIDFFAFRDCTDLTSITIPNSVTSIGGRAMENCSSLTSIIIPGSVTSIGDDAFQLCSSLTSVTILEGVKDIGQGAFHYCANLTSITIPNSVTSIGSNAFSGCTNLQYNEYSNTLYLGNSGNPYLALIRIKSTNITNCIIKEKCKVISSYAFHLCRSLTSITIPNSLKYIGYAAFSGCSGLITIAIPNSVTSIGQKAFEDCTGLTSVHISDLSTWCNITFGGNPLEYAHHLYLNGDEIENLIIPNDVTSINDRAFSGCTGLTSVTIPNSVTSIGNNVFSGCSGLTSVTIPNSIISIGKWVFYECSGLTSVTIPNSVTTIGDSAFRNCSGMTSITIPESVTSIGEYVFEGCSSLISVIIPNSLKFINYRAFYGCSGLTSVTIPDSVTCIGDYAFENCISLSSITIPNNCSIEYRAFYGCSNLTSVTIGSGCRLLFEKIFANCQKLTDVYCYAVQVPPTSHNVFLDSNIENATLHVPAESIELYKTTLPWSNFGTIIALDGDTPKPNKCATPTISYANGKLKFNCETDDVLFNPTIKNDDIKPYNHTEEIDLCVTYQISVYATREGYEDSDVATATLCWIDVEPATEGIVDEDAVTEVKAVPVLIQTQGGNITIQGAAEGTPIAVYDIDGKEYGSAISEKDRTTIATSLRPGSDAIVKIGEKAVKVAIK